MLQVKAKVYSTLISDTDTDDPNSLASILGALPIQHVFWHYLPSNPVYPSIIYRRLNTEQDQIFNHSTLKNPMTFELSIYDSTPSPEKIDKIKDRITELFHGAEATLSDTHLHFYDASVMDDIGDSFLDADDRWFTTLRLQFIVIKVCDLTNNL